MVVSIRARTTSPTDAIAAAVFNWWKMKSNFHVGVDQYFSQIENESITSISDYNIGLLILRVRDYYNEFLVCVENDPFAFFAFSEYAENQRIKTWIIEELGQAVRRSSQFKERLPDIKKCIRKNKSVKKILEL